MKCTVYCIILTLAMSFINALPAKAATSRLYNIDLVDVWMLGPYKYRTVATDLDGDNKKETIGFKLLRNDITINVNGKKTNHFKNLLYMTLELKKCVLENGKNYLYIEAYMTGVPDRAICGLYEYKNGKLEEAYDFRDQFPKTTNVKDVELISVSGNTIKYNVIVLNGVMRYSNAAYKLVYKKGKLRPSSNYGTLNKMNIFSPKKYYRLTKTIKGYRKAKSKKATVKLRKGTKAKIQKIYTNGKITRLRLKLKSGKTVWINGSKKVTSDYMMNPLFKATNPAE